ncbi:hypothetical protein [Niallia circulans]|uniref:hypothetical protein n=1 Tax=Niallia circulans TaxID=1397 RepID=UPI0026ED7577|nr:hypothetical protein [Niallia circulans]
MKEILNVVADILLWLFENIGTLGMFILTFFTVIYSRRMLKETVKTVENAEKSLHLSNKPEVITYFNNERLHTVYFYIKNIGKSPAVDITFDLTLKSGKRIETLHSYYPIKNGVATLMPDQTLYTFVDTTIGLMDENKNYQVYEIKINYKDPEGILYEEIFTLDNSMFKGTFVSDSELGKLIKAAEKIAKEIKNLN